MKYDAYVMKVIESLDERDALGIIMAIVREIIRRSHTCAAIARG